MRRAREHRLFTVPSATPSMRAAVVAVDMQGYSVVETARMLGVAEGTVKSRCSRARRKLAETLEYFAMADGGTVAPSSTSNPP